MRKVHHGSGAAASSRHALLGFLGFLGLLGLLAACGSDKPAISGGASGTTPLAVGITTNGCDPAKLDAAAGQASTPSSTGSGRRAQGRPHGRPNTLADRLDTDVTSLIGEVAKITITPQVMTNGAAGLIEEAARTKITGEEERYSRTDLVTLAANVDGARKIVDLLRPVLQPVDADLQASIDGSLKKVDGLLAPLKSGDSYVSYDQVTDAQRNDLKSSMAQLSEELSQLSGALGLEVKE